MDVLAPFRFTSLIPFIFLPTLLFSLAEGALIPIIPTLAQNSGAGLALAGVLASMLLLGTLVADIPSSWLVRHLGEKTAMISAACLSLLGISLCAFSDSLTWLFIGVFMIGAAAAIFGLARHTLMTMIVAKRYRARALSALAGTFRAGWFIGPFITWILLKLTDSLISIFIFFAFFCLVIIVLLFVLPDPNVLLHAAQKTTLPNSHNVFSNIWHHRHVLLRAGVGVSLISGVRAARLILLPLWALHLNIDTSTTALIIGIGGFVDFTLFYASGQIMDRWGRIWSILPSMILMSLGFFALSFNTFFEGSTAWFVAVTIVLGLGNGIGSGIIMTLGSDFAPKQDPAAFLGAWRFTSDFGQASAGASISALIALISLPITTGLFAILCWGSLAILYKNIPRKTI